MENIKNPFWITKLLKRQGLIGGKYKAINKSKLNNIHKHDLISKRYSIEEDTDDIYVLASNGGPLKPNFKTGIYEHIRNFSWDQYYENGVISEDEYNNETPFSAVDLQEVLNYLDDKGYKRIIIIDYSCNEGMYHNDKVRRDHLIKQRRKSYTRNTKSEDESKRSRSDRSRGGKKKKSKTRKINSKRFTKK